MANVVTYKPVPGWWEHDRYRMPLREMRDGEAYATGYWLDATGASNVAHKAQAAIIAYANAHGLAAASAQYPRDIRLFDWEVTRAQAHAS